MKSHFHWQIGGFYDFRWKPVTLFGTGLRFHVPTVFHLQSSILVVTMAPAQAGEVGRG
jgi:hypothetical protein